MKLPNIRSTESNQMSMSRIFLQSVSLCLLFVKSSLFLKSPDYLFEESRLFVQSSGSKCTVYMCLLFVRSVSLRLKSLALLRAAIKSYSKLVLYSPKTGNIFSEKKRSHSYQNSGRFGLQPIIPNCSNLLNYCSAHPLKTLSDLKRSSHNVNILTF